MSGSPLENGLGYDRTVTGKRLPSGVMWLSFLAPLVLAAVITACGADDVRSAPDEDAADTTALTTTLTTTSPPTTTSSSSTSEPSATGEDTDTANDDIEPVVFNDDFGTSVQPIFADRCAACHSPGGPGTGHWELTTAQALADDHGILSAIVASGYMPPWPAGGDSPAFKHDRSLRPDQLQAIVDWSEAGAPLDVPGDTPIEATTPVVGLQSPDLVIGPAEPYAGSPTVRDDYRCLVYDPELPDGGWITDYEFIPDQSEVVHHAIGYLLPASARADAAARDGEDGKPGWQCYGSSGLGASDIFLGWAPGQLPSEFPEGTGLAMEPGDFIVVQIHYHYEGSAPADASTLALNVMPSDEDLAPITVSEFVAPAEIPCSTGEEGPLCDRDAAMAAAVARYGQEGVRADAFLRLCGYTVEDFAGMTDGTASASCDIPAALVGATGEIVSVLGHEHEIGSWFKMTINPGQPDERVLLDIPEWDFDWQYNYEPVESIVLYPDDVVRIECGWDRSLRDPSLEPAYVLWADGTDDEMCFATITTRPVR